MGLTKKSTLAAVMLSAIAAPCIIAQEKTESSFYFGVGGGFHSSKMKITKLDKDVFPENKSQNSGLFDFFLQYEFGKQKQFGVRLEFDFLKRGGTLGNIYNTDVYPGLYAEEGIDDSRYSLRSSYFDIRLPLIYQFCGARNAIRPYLFIAPMVAFSTGGTIKAQTDFTDGSFVGQQMDITGGNMRSAYFGGAVGVGLKYDLNLYGHPFYISVEAGYQMGFTNTYSSKEMDGSAIVKNSYYHNVYDITGKRTFNGFEIKGSISIPFSVFTKKKKVVVEEAYVPAPVFREIVEPEPAPVAQIAEKEEIPCRSIEEIYEMIAKGESIHGITFCSIDDIRFKINSSDIDPVSHKYLDEVASILKTTGVCIEVKGHTDNTGTEEYNRNLSRRRAMAVVKYLESWGVQKQQLSYSYYGSSEPIATNDTERGRSYNRRVEFEIK